MTEKHTIIVGHIGRDKKRAVAVVKHVNMPVPHEQKLQKIATIKIAEHPSDKNKYNISMEISYGDTAENAWNWASNETPSRRVEINGNQYLLKGDWHPRTHVELSVDKDFFQIPDEKKIFEILKAENISEDIKEKDGAILRHLGRFEIKYVGFGPHYEVGENNRFQKAVPRIFEVQHEGKSKSTRNETFAGLMGAKVRSERSKPAKHDLKIPETFTELGNVHNIVTLIHNALLDAPKDNVDFGPLNYLINAHKELDRRVRNTMSWEEWKTAKDKLRTFTEHLILSPPRLEAYRRILIDGERSEIPAFANPYVYMSIFALSQGNTSAAKEFAEMAKTLEEEHALKHRLRSIYGARDEYAKQASKKILQRVLEPLYPGEVKEIPLSARDTAWETVDSQKRKYKVIYGENRLIILPVRKEQNKKTEIHGSPAVVLDLNSSTTYVGTYDKKGQRIVGAAPLDKVYGHTMRFLKSEYGYSHERTSGLADIAEQIADDYLDIYSSKIQKLAKISGAKIPGNYEDLFKIATKDAKIHIRSPAHILATVLSSVVDAHDTLAIKRAREKGDNKTLMRTILQSEFSKIIANMEICNIVDPNYTVAEYLAKMYEKGMGITVGDTSNAKDLLQKIKSADKKLRKEIADKIIKNAQEQLRRHGISVPEPTLRKMLSEMAEKFPENFLKVVINMPPTVRGKLLAPAQSAAKKYEKESMDAFNYHKDLVRALARIAINDGNIVENLKKLIEEQREEAGKGIQLENTLESAKSR